MLCHKPSMNVITSAGFILQLSPETQKNDVTRSFPKLLLVVGTGRARTVMSGSSSAVNSNTRSRPLYNSKNQNTQCPSTGEWIAQLCYTSIPDP